MPIELTHPWFLLLGVFGAALLWLVMRRSLAGMTPAQRRACVAVRASLLAGILLALAGARFLWHGNDLAVLFVVDASASVSPEAREEARSFVAGSLRHRRGHDVAGVIGFGQTPSVWQPVGESGRLADRWPALPETARTGTEVPMATIVVLCVRGLTLHGPVALGEVVADRISGANAS